MCARCTAALGASPLNLEDYLSDMRYAARAALVGSRGLLGRHNQALAEMEHKARVFANHGLTDRDLSLLGEKCCVHLVNSRRHVERAISIAAERAANATGVRFYSKVELPSCR